MRVPGHSLIVALVTSLALTASQDRPRTLVAVLAHADDESAAAPALARYAREGVQVYFLIVADEKKNVNDEDLVTIVTNTPILVTQK